MPDRPRILLIEDDRKLAGLVKEFLERQGFIVKVETRGDTAADRIVIELPDLVILDLMLPGLDGLSVCRSVRPRFDGPILMLTARSDEVDEVVGLEVGADDYMAKPVRPRLLLARIHNLLRRTRPALGATQAALEVGPLRVELSSRTATIHGRPLTLTTSEFELLRYLAARAGKVVQREEIFLDLRGIEWDGVDRSIDLRVTRLRKKLGDDARRPRLIKSVRGVGYLLAVET